MKRLPLAATWDDPRLLEGCSEGTDRLWCEGSQRPPSWRIIVTLAPMGRNLKQIAKAKITWNHGWVKESSAIFIYTNTSLLQVPHSFATMLQWLQQSNKCLVETQHWLTERPQADFEKNPISVQYAGVQTNRNLSQRVFTNLYWTRCFRRCFIHRLKIGSHVGSLQNACKVETSSYYQYGAILGSLYHLSQHCPTTPTTLQVGKVKQLIIKNLSRRWDQITNASAQLLLSSFLPQKIRRKKNNKKKQEFTKIVSWIEGVPNTKAFRVRESVAKLWDLP